MVAYTYEPFGAATASGSLSNAVRFTGREDDGTGLYFYRSRYYSPTLHRFMNEDPLEYADGVNLLTYTRNDPVNMTDPKGTSSCCREQQVALALAWAAFSVACGLWFFTGGASTGTCLGMYWSVVQATISLEICESRPCPQDCPLNPRRPGCPLPQRPPFREPDPVRLPTTPTCR
ncbi:MAG: RHS repeat-associated core domain-containing protein [Bryobacterales bacterium]|nr:RHS repeat-associated core domain-containing protein [Bryobacterales bacterium]